MPMGHVWFDKGKVYFGTFTLGYTTYITLLYQPNSFWSGVSVLSIYERSSPSCLAFIVNGTYAMPTISHTKAVATRQTAL